MCCPPNLRSTHLDLGQSEQTLDLTDEAIEFDRLDVIIVAACFYRLVAIVMLAEGARAEAGGRRTRWPLRRAPQRTSQ